MTARVLVVEHEAKCPPALVGAWLTETGCAVRVCRPYAGDALPSRGEYDALLVLGGSMGANDDADHPWLPPLKEIVRDAVARGVPTFGICLGHQLIAAALGGEVTKNPHGQQLGLLRVGWLPTAADDPMMGPAPEMRGIHWNNDIVVRLPEGAELLAAADGDVQAVRFAPTAWGVQLHPEADEHVVASWAAGDREDHQRRGIDQAALLDDIAAARRELDAAWRPVFERFAALARSARPEEPHRTEASR